MTRVLITGGRGMLGRAITRQVQEAGHTARDRHTRIIPIHLPGWLAAAIRQGGLTCPTSTHGQVTWAEWLQRTYGRRASQPGTPLHESMIGGHRG